MPGHRGVGTQQDETQKTPLLEAEPTAKCCRYQLCGAGLVLAFILNLGTSHS